MVVRPIVRAADRHDKKVFSGEDALVVHRGLQKRLIVLHPLGPVNGLEHFAQARSRNAAIIRDSLCLLLLLKNKGVVYTYTSILHHRQNQVFLLLFSALHVQIELDEVAPNRQQQSRR